MITKRGDVVLVLDRRHLIKGDDWECYPLTDEEHKNRKMRLVYIGRVTNKIFPNEIKKIKDFLGKGMTLGWGQSATYSNPWPITEIYKKI